MRSTIDRHCIAGWVVASGAIIVGISAVSAAGFNEVKKTARSIEQASAQVKGTVIANSGFNPGNIPDQPLTPGQTSVVDLSKYFLDPATTNGTVVTFNTSQGTFNVTLFDKDAPQTVTNFLDYVQAGAYNSDVFHRLSNLGQTSPAQPPPTPYQLLQGGGFGVNTDGANNVTGFTTVSTFSPIQNESNDSLHPNAIGTLAMARGVTPNSATSQFFFNLTNNSQTLAAGNGQGSTVFGIVSDNTGLTVLQNFAANYTPTDVTTSTGISSFFAFPLINGFTPASNFPTGATTSDLAIINNITVTTPPTGHLTYSIVSNSNPSVVIATLGSNTLGSGLSANQLQLAAGPTPGTSVIRLQITDKAGETVTRQFSVVVANATPGLPQIDGHGTIAAPNGGRDAQFFIFDVENEQVTPQFLEGQFGYLDKRSHINFITGQIETVTINGNQGTFTGTTKIGGPRNRRAVQFTVTITANAGANPDTFSISLSNGYTAGGALTSGTIAIRVLDPDPLGP